MPMHATQHGPGEHTPARETHTDDTTPRARPLTMLARILGGLTLLAALAIAALWLFGAASITPPWFGGALLTLELLIALLLLTYPTAGPAMPARLTKR